MRRHLLVTGHLARRKLGDIKARDAHLNRRAPPEELTRRPVVHVNTEHGYSGGEVQVFLLMEGLRDLGVEQVLVAPAGSESAKRGRAAGFCVCELGLGHQLDVVGVARLAMRLRGAALVHLHTGRAAWLGSLAARLVGCPVVITRRMDRTVRPGLRTWLAYRKTARVVIAISGPVAQLLQRAGVPKERVTVIPDALDPARLVSTVTRADTRAKLGAGDDAFVVLALAQLTRRKGVDVLLRALAESKTSGLRCMIAGDGPERKALEQLARDLGLGDRALFLGRRGDAGDLLAACDLFCLPSRAEGMGVAALEALGAGRAVVASRVGGLGELIVDGRSGLLVEPEDVSGLAAAIMRVREDDELRARLEAAGPRRVDEGFRAEQYVDRHVALYRDVLA